MTIINLKADGLRKIEAVSGLGRVLTAQGSITDAAFVRAVADRACTMFGSVDGLVNNAGITRRVMIARMTVEQWQQVIDVHLTGSFHGLRAVGLRMIDQATAGRRHDREALGRWFARLGRLGKHLTLTVDDV